MGALARRVRSVGARLRHGCNTLLRGRGGAGLGGSPGAGAASLPEGPLRSWASPNRAVCALALSALAGGCSLTIAEYDFESPAGQAGASAPSDAVGGGGAAGSSSGEVETPEGPEPAAVVPSVTPEPGGGAGTGGAAAGGSGGGTAPARWDAPQTLWDSARYN